MCLQTINTYAHCVHKYSHYVICYAHIQHTHQQIDNAPCPDARVEMIESESKRCGCKWDGLPCHREFSKTHKDTYKFERAPKADSAEQQRKAMEKKVKEEQEAEAELKSLAIDSMDEDQPSTSVPKLNLEVAAAEKVALADGKANIKVKRARTAEEPELNRPKKIKSEDMMDV